MKFAVAATVLAAALTSVTAVPARAAAPLPTVAVQPSFEVAKAVKKRTVGKKPGKAKKARPASGRK